MSVDELRAQHPHLIVNAEKLGESSADFDLNSNVSKEFDFDGLLEIDLRFLDGRLSKIDYIYLANDALTPHEFTDKVIEKLGLHSEWCQSHLFQQCVISCEGFEVSITPQQRYISAGGLSGDPARVSLRDLVAAQKLEARQKAQEEEEKAKFRP
jgi:hypothetical protein